MTPRRLIAIALFAQTLSAMFFFGNIVSSVFGFAPINWQISEYIEMGAAGGLILGVVLGAVMLRRTTRENARMTQQLRAASTAFRELLDERFDEWGLTAAERDVARFAIKGLSTQEIASLMSTSEGTVKAQTNAIYRKAGVSGRPQLLSVFIDDLMDEDALKRASQTA